MRYPILLTVAAAFLTGCASIISGTSQAITIDSNVPGATVSIEGNVVGVTPYSGKIPRKKESIAIVSKAGYTSQPITLTTSFNPVAILSIFWDYSTTDCITGAVWEYAPNSYYANLRPAGTSYQKFERDTQLKAFAMTYHGDFQAELVAGSGAKIEALRNEFFKHMSSADLLATLRAIDAEAKGNAVVFGEKLAAFASR